MLEMLETLSKITFKRTLRVCLIMILGNISNIFNTLRVRLILILKNVYDFLMFEK